MQPLVRMRTSQGYSISILGGLIGCFPTVWAAQSAFEFLFSLRATEEGNGIRPIMPTDMCFCDGLVVVVVGGFYRRFRKFPLLGRL